MTSVEAEEAVGGADGGRGFERGDVGRGPRGGGVVGEQGFERGGDLEDFGVAAAGADDLQAEGHPVVVLADGQGDGGVADDGDGVGHGEPVEVAAGRRAVDFGRVEFAPGPGTEGDRGGDDDVVALKEALPAVVEGGLQGEGAGDVLGAVAQAFRNIGANVGTDLVWGVAGFFQVGGQEG